MSKSNFADDIVLFEHGANRASAERNRNSNALYDRLCKALPLLSQKYPKQNTVAVKSCGYVVTFSLDAFRAGVDKQDCYLVIPLVKVLRTDGEENQ